jgi:hypothetical protein
MSVLFGLRFGCKKPLVGFKVGDSVIEQVYLSASEISTLPSHQQVPQGGMAPSR